MIKFIREIFQSPEGEISSKRVVAIGLVVCGIVMSFQGNPEGKFTYGAGVGLLLGQAITKT